MTSKYYTLALFEDGQWIIAFGDYEEHTVLEEYADEYADEYQSCAIIITDGRQSEIDIAIEHLNMGRDKATHSAPPTRH